MRQNTAEPEKSSGNLQASLKLTVERHASLILNGIYEAVSRQRFSKLRPT
jgi:hypothetical protein